MNLKSVFKKASYLLSGLSGRLTNQAICPSCHAADASIVDRKFFHELRECRACRLLYRFPSESASSMDAFYQEGYEEPGLTTELPDEVALDQLLKTEFKGSGKDFSYHISILRALGLRDGGRVLDYGANWGYMSWQLQRAGYDAVAFEISVPRARFGLKLGVDVKTTVEEVGGDFDMVYSSHVLEHVPDPAASIRQQLSLLKPGGLLVAHTPNGCRSFREKHYSLFHQTRGRFIPCC